MAGDIGYPFHSSYKQYLQELSPNYKQVFVISGNHEYYQTDREKKTIDEVDQKIQEITQSLPNITYLNNTSATIECNTKILGTTLWTDIPRHARGFIQYGMTDYYKIFTGKQPYLVTPSITSALHERNVWWLKKEINESKEEKVVVVSHHLPSLQFISDKYKGHSMNNAFVTDLEYLIKKPVVAWIAGHTHSCKSFTYNDVQCEVNSKGYPHESYGGFRDDAVILV